MIAYRRDIFEAEGVDASRLTTWGRFIEAGRRITRDLDGDGTIDRYMMELTCATADHFQAFLYQRGGGYFDADGRLIMDNELGFETLCWFIPLVAGPDRIGTALDRRGLGQVLSQALQSGYLVSLICPDWRTRMIEMDMPRVAGDMALMPLPAVREGGPRTSTWGGTMLGITKNSPHHDLAWELALHLYYDLDQLGDRFQETNIIPPLRDAWRLPAFAERDPYWSGQPIGLLYAEQADDTPPRYGNPYGEMAYRKLGEVVSACARYYEQHGATGFRDFARRTLEGKAEEVRTFMRRNPFLSL